jgi:hypothetical protein
LSSGADRSPPTAPSRSGRHSLALFKWGAKSILPMKY